MTTQVIDKPISHIWSPQATAVDAFTNEVEPAVFAMLGLRYLDDNGVRLLMTYDWPGNQITMFSPENMDLTAAAEFIRNYPFDPAPYLAQESQPKVPVEQQMAAMSAMIVEMDKKLKAAEEEIKKLKEAKK